MYADGAAEEDAEGINSLHHPLIPNLPSLSIHPDVGRSPSPNVSYVERVGDGSRLASG